MPCRDSAFLAYSRHYLWVLWIKVTRFTLPWYNRRIYGLYATSTDAGVCTWSARIIKLKFHQLSIHVLLGCVIELLQTISITGRSHFPKLKCIYKCSHLVEYGWPSDTVFTHEIDTYYWLFFWCQISTTYRNNALSHDALPANLDITATALHSSKILKTYTEFVPEDSVVPHSPTRYW